MLRTPWERRCPMEGHTSWRIRSDGYYCEPCDETFDELVDMTGDA